MAKEVQISAFVSEETSTLLDRYSRATGIKKGHLIEVALRQHLRALHELPSDVIIPPKLVVSRKSLEAIASRLSGPGKPTTALKKLLSRRGD